MDAYLHIERNEKHALVRADVSDAVSAALFAEKGCTGGIEGGRGTVVRFEYPGGVGIVRRYLRGGAMRFLLQDAYLCNRPLSEFEVHRAASEAGLSVPPLLGVCWWRSGFFLRGAIATHALDAKHLQAWLFAAAGDAEEMCRRCGRLVRAMHDTGIWHADLQLRNILVAPDGPYLIDFDGARRYRRLSSLRRSRNLLRLRRSIEKNGVDPTVFDWILAGYDGIDPPRCLGGLYAFKGAVSDLLSGSNRRHV